MGEIITNKAIQQATGRTWDEWFTELDNAPNQDADGAVQSWLTEHHTEIGGWWCQVITRRWESRREAAVSEVS